MLQSGCSRECALSLCGGWSLIDCKEVVGRGSRNDGRAGDVNGSVTYRTMQLGSAVDNGVRHQVALAICAAGHSIHGSSPLFSRLERRQGTFVPDRR